MRLLEKLFRNGYRNEKEIEKLSLKEALKIPGITVEELKVLVSLQTAVKGGKVLSFLAAEKDEEAAQARELKGELRETIPSS